MPARNAVAAATMVATGFSGVADPLSGPHNYFLALARTANPEAFVDGLGSRYEIMGTNIKRWSVGSPIIAAMDGVVALIREHNLRAEDVEHLIATIPESGLRTVDNRHMPDVNIQHALAVALLDHGFSFAAAHDYDRMSDPAVLEIRKRLTVLGDPAVRMSNKRGQAIIEIKTRDGRDLSIEIRAVRGTADNPMTRDEVEEKARDLLEPIVGSSSTAKLIEGVWNLENVGSVVDLRSALQPGGR
jgi:2-methylcitrate dehydratase PrpD